MLIHTSSFSLKNYTEKSKEVGSSYSRDFTAQMDIYQALSHSDINRPHGIHCLEISHNSIARIVIPLLNPSESIPQNQSSEFTIAHMDISQESRKFQSPTWIFSQESRNFRSPTWIFRLESLRTQPPTWRFSQASRKNLQSSAWKDHRKSLTIQTTTWIDGLQEALGSPEAFRCSSDRPAREIPVSETLLRLRRA